jgi:hypothetical protein
MTPLLIDFEKDPDVQLRIDSYSVPAEARAEFEQGMQRSLAFLEALPGFRGHLACVKTSGGSTFNIVTIAVWQNSHAIANAITEVQAHYARIGYDPRVRSAQLGITADIGNHYVPMTADLAIRASRAWRPWHVTRPELSFERPRAAVEVQRLARAAKRVSDDVQEHPACRRAVGTGGDLHHVPTDATAKLMFMMVIEQNGSDGW